MDKKYNFKDKKITVMGLGLHGGGLCTTKWLAEQGAKILVTDLKSKAELKESIDKLKKYKIKYVLGKHRAEDFKDVDMIIKNPGVPRESQFLKIATDHKIPIETDLSLFFSICNSPTIGITGTKGKSTTTWLIYKFLKATKSNPVIAGNIKISPLSILNKIKPNTPVVLELSSWQLEDMQQIKKSPNIALITNLMPDHLNRYKSMAEYVKSKKLILKFQTSKDIAILNYDNELTKEFGKQVKGRRFWFSGNKEIKEQNSCFVRKGWIVFRQYGEENIICPIKDIKVPGQHNLENILAAVVVAKVSSVSNVIIRKVLKDFKGVPDRLELIRSWKGIRFYNDTTATAPDAAIAGLKSFDEKVILLAGGYDKKLKYAEFAQIIKQKSDFTYLFKGDASDKLIKELNKIRYKNWQVIKNMPEGVGKAIKKTGEVKIILLSPGAASFGMFVNEFDRGDKFKELVKKLK